MAAAENTTAPASRVVHTSEEAEPILGVTVIDDQLFVLRRRRENAVEVYNTSTYNLVRQHALPEAVESISDMTGCKRYHCLYIADPVENCVHRFDVHARTFTGWRVNDEPSGLSVTSQFHILVACFESCKLRLFSKDGKQLRDVDLQSDLVHPQHAIQLTAGLFVVSHGSARCEDPVHRVCMVDGKGCVIRSYGGAAGPEAGQLNVPCHLAVDDDRIFVADRRNRRVLVLSKELSLCGEVLTGSEFKRRPARLCLEASSRRLYVAENELEDDRFTAGRLIVVQL